jgi:transposase
LKSEKICKIWKKPKLNSDKIWKIQKKIVKIYRNYGRKASRIDKRFEKIQKKIVKRYEKYGRKVS